MHFKLNFLYNGSVSFFCKFSQHYLLKRLSFPRCIFLASLSYPVFCWCLPMAGLAWYPEGKQTWEIPTDSLISSLHTTSSMKPSVWIPQSLSFVINFLTVPYWLCSIRITACELPEDKHWRGVSVVSPSLTHNRYKSDRPGFKSWLSSTYKISDSC